MTTKRASRWCSCGSTTSPAASSASSSTPTYAAARELLTVDRILVVKGRVDHKEGETKLIALEVAAFEAVAEKREVRLRIDAMKARPGTIRELAELIRDFPGESPVYVDCLTSQGPRVYAFGPQFRVEPVRRLLRRGQDAPRRGRRRLTRFAQAAGPRCGRRTAPTGRLIRIKPLGSVAMSDYTVMNLKEVEDAAVGFGRSPDLEARFARKPLGSEQVAISYQRLAPGVRTPVRPSARPPGGDLRRPRRRRPGQDRRRDDRRRPVGRGSRRAAGDTRVRGRPRRRRAARDRRAARRGERRRAGPGVVGRLTVGSPR